MGKWDLWVTEGLRKGFEGRGEKVVVKERVWRACILGFWGDNSLRWGLYV